MSLEIVPLQEKHLEDAAALACARQRALRELVSPILPTRYEDVGVILPMLRDIAGQSPGVAAIRGGRLAGFLVGWMLPQFRGKRAVFSPEWANGADLEDSRRIYEKMYACLSARWVADGCLVHLVGMLAHDRDGVECWHWLGFGLCAADAVRDLSPAHGPISGAGVSVRRAWPIDADIEQAVVLGEALQRHLVAAPTFLHDERESRDGWEEWLKDPVNALWLAYDADCGSEAVAFLRMGPANPDACTIIRDEGTASIVGAFTREGVRGRGIATVLLNQSLAWARAEGYERCAVDFEPMNVLAARFWTRHFRPVCYSLIRHVDERVTQGAT